MSVSGTNVADLVRRLLDRDYAGATEAVLRAIAGTVSGGIVARRLEELDAEAARLAEAGERLTVDNAVMRALASDLETAMRANAQRLDALAPDLQVGAVNAAGQITRQLALPGMDDPALRAIGISWNVPDAEAVNNLVQYIGSPAWAAEVNGYAAGIVGTVNNQAILGVVSGWNPIHTAREIRRLTNDLPAYTANNLLRTLHLTSYRSAVPIHQLANADIVTEQIRIAVLDDRTCLSCIALHGQHMPIGERIDDHWSGRCTSITLVHGRRWNIQSGEDWFFGLPVNRQQEIAGFAAWNALDRRAVTLREFVHVRQDPIFGRQLQEASLKGILGEQAAQYYKRNQ